MANICIYKNPGYLELKGKDPVSKYTYEDQHLPGHCKGFGVLQQGSTAEPQQEPTSDQNLISRNKLSWILSNLDRNIRKAVEKKLQ